MTSVSVLPTLTPPRCAQGITIDYEYDFGDSWQHLVELKQILVVDEKFMRRIVDGARAFPLEDCGGPPGYEDLVAVAAGGEAQYHDTETLRQWGGHWDPERFDLEAVRRTFDQ